MSTKNCGKRGKYKTGRNTVSTKNCGKRGKYKTGKAKGKCKCKFGLRKGTAKCRKRRASRKK